MFSFIKFAHKILNSVFNTNSPLILEQFYQHADLKNAQWVSLAVNKKTIAESFLTKELEILTSTDAYSLKIAESTSEFTHQLWQNQRPLCKISVAHQSPFLSQFNQLIDQLIEVELKKIQVALNRNLVAKNFNSSEISQDEKALEWMRVSFQILEKAIIESLTNPEFLFQTLLFMGQNPKSQMHEIRLIIFNLDIKFVLLESGLLRIRIYDDKNAQFGNSKKAVLEGDFNFRKREMLDELTKLISIVSPGIKIHTSI